jgi:hypothetical protein
MSELLKKTRDEEWTRALSAVARMLVFVSQEERTPVLSEEEATDLAVFVLEHELSERGLKPPSGEYPVSARPAISRRGVIAEAEAEVARLAAGLLRSQQPGDYSQGYASAEAESIVRACLAQVVDFSGRR